MGMTGGEGAMLAALLGSSFMGGIMAPEGQELSSFEGRGDLDPGAMMGEGKDLIGGYLDSLMALANEPVDIKTTVNPLPSFVGGALPMAISVPGMDVNRLKQRFPAAGSPANPNATPPLPKPFKRTLADSDTRDARMPKGGAGDRENTPYPPTPGQGPQMPENERGEGGDNDPNNNYGSSEGDPTAAIQLL